MNRRKLPSTTARTSGLPSPLPHCATEFSAAPQSDSIERLIGESAHIGLIEFTPGIWVLDCNDALARMLGFADRRELRGLHASDLFVDSAELVRGLSVLQPRETLQRELRMVCRVGGAIWVAVHALRISGEYGQEGKIIATLLYLNRCVHGESVAPPIGPVGRFAPVWRQP